MSRQMSLIHLFDPAKLSTFKKVRVIKIDGLQYK